MEKYHKSVQGICLIKHLKLPNEIINRIRYYVNFSVDITGYTRLELIRYITTEHRRMNIILRTKHRSEIIRFLYDNNIHIKPRKIVVGITRFKNICDIFTSKVYIDNNIFYMYDNDDNIIEPYIENNMKLLIRNSLSSNEGLYDYHTGYWPIRYIKRKNKIQLPFFRTNGVFHHTKIFSIQIDFWEYIFMILHHSPEYHAVMFKQLNKKQIDRYFKFMQEFNVTKETTLSKKFYEDCNNASLEYINLSLLSSKLI